MMIINKIKIGGNIYDVILDKSLSAGRDRFGEYRPVTGEIAIDSNLKLDEMEQTLIHEIGEVIKCQNDLDMNHQTLSTFCNSFYQVLKDNKLNFND